MTNHRISSRLCWALCLAVLLGHTMVTAANYFTLLRESRLVYPMVPLPTYRFMQVPDEPGTPTSQGADFSQVYLSAQALRHGDAPYAPRDPAFRDRFGRRPNYPPLTNHLYMALTPLSFRNALVVHTAATLLLFMGLTVLLLRGHGLSNLALPACTACLLLGLLTPVGFSHFERGQFDFIAGSAIMLVTASAYEARTPLRYAAGSALLAALKWTAASFVGLFSLLGLVASGSSKRRLAFWTVPLLLVLSVAIFPSQIADYLPSIRLYEVGGAPAGVSLAHVLPRSFAKAVPVLCTLLFVGLFIIRSRRGWDRQRAFEAVAVPFGLGLALATLCMLVNAYEYRAVSLLGLLPVTLIWIDRATDVPITLRKSVAVLFGVFLVVAFRVFDFSSKFLSGRQMLFVYCTWSALFFVIAIRILWSLPTPNAALSAIPE